MNNVTEIFIDLFGEELFDELCEDAYIDLGGKLTESRFTFDEHIRRNAANYTHVGSFEADGKTWHFELDCGDWNGSVLVQLSKEPIEPDRSQAIYKFVPDRRKNNTEDKMRLSLNRLALWEKQDWFIKKTRALNYDYTFAPGHLTSTHYETWAKQKGLEIAIVHVDG